MPKMRLGELSDQEYEKEIKGKKPLVSLKIFKGNSGKMIYNLHTDSEDVGDPQLILWAIEYLEHEFDTLT